MCPCANSTTTHSRLRRNVRIVHRSAVTSIETADGNVRVPANGAGPATADYYISALPFERLHPLLPDLAHRVGPFEHSPITGIHLWFDRPVTDLPHATLLDRTIQWMFNKSEGRYIQVVVSASRTLVETPRNQIIDLAVRELAEFFPLVKEARLEKAQVIKEVRATFSAQPGHGTAPARRCNPAQQSFSRRRLDTFRLAGHNGRRGAQRLYRRRSGCRRGGYPQRFLLPDIA